MEQVHGAAWSFSSRSDAVSCPSEARGEEPEDVERMAVPHFVRAYSTDSVGSDAVFAEDLHFPGMLKSTEGKKGSTEHLPP